MPDAPNENRRSNPRIVKTYTFNYHLKGDGKWDSSIVKNISRGGICFNSPIQFPPETDLILEINIPYFAPAKTVINAVVLQSKEISAGKNFEIRAKFVDLTPEVMKELDIIEQKNVKERGHGSY
jgi:hypothetical protein